MPKKKPDILNLQKSYNNLDFLNSPAARNIRILCEMTEPATRLRKHRVFNTVVFFGSARSLPMGQAKKKLSALKKAKSKSPNHRHKLHLAQQQIKLSQYYEDASLLSEKLTRWFNQPENINQNFYICSGGGPGMMEAANRGAKLARGKSVGLNISLPFEQTPNAFQTPDISFEFHYFFIRKFWFFYLAKALVVFPGGFGTFDELFELLTVIQTQKTSKHMPVVLYGKEFWNEVVDFDALYRWGVISKADLKLYEVFDDVDEAFLYLQKELRKNYFRPSR